MDKEAKIKQLMDDINNLGRENIDIQKKIADNKSSIKTLELELWNTCDHMWVRDLLANFDDLCKYYCQTCGLWRDKRIYSIK